MRIYLEPASNPQSSPQFVGLPSDLAPDFRRRALRWTQVAESDSRHPI